MKDPFDILRAELVSAAERAALPAPRKRWGWLRRPSRPMAVLLVALVIAGAGGAAVLLARSASQPLAGRVPGAITPASLAGYSYTIAVTPSLAAGTAGWESLIIYTRTGASIQPPQSGGTLVQPGPSGGTLGYPTATSPVFGGGTGPDSCPVCFARGNAVTYVLTGPQAFAVRIGSQTIRTITSPALPTGDRAAVVFIPAKGRVFLVPRPRTRPGPQTSAGDQERPPRPRRAARPLRAVDRPPVDAFGRVLESCARQVFGKRSRSAALDLDGT